MGGRTATLIPACSVATAASASTAGWIAGQPAGRWPVAPTAPTASSSSMKPPRSQPDTAHARCACPGNTGDGARTPCELPDVELVGYENPTELKRLKRRTLRSTAQRYGRGLGYRNAAFRPQSKMRTIIRSPILMSRRVELGKKVAAFRGSAGAAPQVLLRALGLPLIPPRGLGVYERQELPGECRPARFVLVLEIGENVAGMRPREVRPFRQRRGVVVEPAQPQVPEVCGAHRRRDQLIALRDAQRRSGVV